MQPYLYGLTGLEFFTQTTQMAAAGLLKLLYSGFQEDRLLPPKGQPRIDNYDKAYLKSGRFTTEWYKVHFDGNPSFGKTVKATIPRRGHLVTRAFLVTVMPDIRTVQAAVEEITNTTNDIFAGPYFGWTNSIGHALINEAEVTVGATPIDRLDGRLMEVLDEYNTPIEKVTTVNRMLGRYDSGFSYKSNGYDVTNQTVITPLPFWFSKGEPENALPIDAIGLDTVQISIHYNELSKLYVSYKKTFLNLKGVFNANTTYNVDDIIQWTDGNFYKCFQKYMPPIPMNVSTQTGSGDIFSYQLGTNLQFPNAYLFGFITTFALFPSGIRTSLLSDVPLNTVGNKGDLAIVTSNRLAYIKVNYSYTKIVSNNSVPWQTVIDENGNIYTSDNINNVIYIYNKLSGSITTIGGGGSNIGGNVDANGTNALFNSPTDIELDIQNKFLYVLDSGNNVIRAVNILTNDVTTVNYIPPAQLYSMTIDSSNNLYVADNPPGTYSTLYKVVITPGTYISTSSIIILTFVDGAPIAMLFDDPTQSLYVSNGDNTKLYKVSIIDPERQELFPLTFGFISDIVFDKNKNVFISDYNTSTIYQINFTAGTRISIIDISAYPPGNLNQISFAFDSDDSIVIAFDAGDSLYRFTTPGPWVPAVRNLPNSSALLTDIGAQSIVSDLSGNIYIADRNNSRIIIYNVNTNITIFIGGVFGYQDGIGIDAQFSAPSVLYIDSTYSYLFVYDIVLKNIRRITLSTQSVSTLEYDFSANSVNAITLDSNNNLIICDGMNILRLTLTAGSDVPVSTSILFQIPTNNPYFLLAIDKTNTNIYGIDGTATTLYKIPISTPSSFISIGQTFLGISDFRIDHDGNLIIVDIASSIIYQINANSLVVNILVSGATLPSGIQLPSSVYINNNGTFYVGFLNPRSIYKYTLGANWNTLLTTTSPVFNTNTIELYVAFNANIYNGYNNLINLVAPFPSSFIPKVGNAITGPFIPAGTYISGINVSTYNPTTTLPYDGITIQITNNLSIEANIHTGYDSSGTPKTYTYIIYNTPYIPITDTASLLQCFNIIPQNLVSSSEFIEPNNTKTTSNCPSYSEIESSEFKRVSGNTVEGLRMPSSLDIKSAHILLEYVYLDKPEANRIRLGDLTYRIKQHYALNPYLTNGQPTARIPIRIPNLTTDLYFMANRVDADSVNAPFLASRDLMNGADIWWPDASGLGKRIFTQLVPAYSKKESEPIQAISLLYEGKMVRYGTDAPVFFRSILSSFDKRKTPWHNKYYYNIPFGLNNVGHANMDKLQKVELALEFKPNTGTLSVTNIPNYTIYVWAETYGILRVYGGRAGLLFGY